MSVDVGNALRGGQRHEVRLQVRARTIGDRAIDDAPKIGLRRAVRGPTPNRLDKSPGVDAQLAIHRLLVRTTQVPEQSPGDLFGRLVIDRNAVGRLTVQQGEPTLSRRHFHAASVATRRVGCNDPRSSVRRAVPGRNFTARPAANPRKSSSLCRAALSANARPPNSSARS